MPRGSLALRSTQNWRLIANEQKVSDRIPVMRIRDGNTLITKNGDAMRVFRLRGLASETLPKRSVEAMRDTLANLYRQHGDARTAFYVHTIRTRIREADLPTRKQATGFAGYVDTLRRAELATSALYRIEHFLTLVRRPLIKTPRWLASRRAQEEDKIEHIAARTEISRSLDEIGLAAQTMLARLGPQALTTETDDGAFLTGFLSTLVNGAATPMPQTSTGLDVMLPTHRPIFRGETLELRGPAPEDTRYAAMMALKAYGDATWPGALNAMLAAPCEFIATQSFIPRETTDTLARMKWTRRKMEVAEDEAHSLADDLDNAMDDVAAGREVFGDHHISIAVLADSEFELASATSDMVTTLTAANLRPVREDIALEALWWAQIPGNMAYRARTALISGRNFADLAPFHTHASGNDTNLTWKAPIALLETDSGTPFWFNFHARGQSANGNTLVFGPSGAGKTALVGFLITSAMTLPRPPRIFYFDKDRGAEATIRALGGRYACLRPDDAIGFNPFAEAIDARGQAWLRDWITARLPRPPTPLQRDAIAEAVTTNAEAWPGLRRFRNFAELFNGLDDSGAISDALAEWHSGATRSWLFDQDRDALDFSKPITGFDMTAILRDEANAEAFIDYLFYRLDRALESGEPTIIVLDEAWRLLKSGAFAAKIEDWLKTVRNQNGLVVFLSQEPEDAARSDIAPAIISSTATKIFFPNETASEPVYREVFGLSEREFELLRTTPIERRSFLIKQGASAAFARLDLSGAPDLLKVFSGTAESVAELIRLRAAHGDQWLSKYMETE